MTSAVFYGKVKDYPDIEGLDLVKEVTCDRHYDWIEGTWRWNARNVVSQERFKVAALDFGIKRKHFEASG